MMGGLDHGFTILIVLLVPVWGWRRYRRLRAQLLLDGGQRRAAYRRGALTQIALALLLALLWRSEGRVPRLLGLHGTWTPMSWFGLGIGSVFAATHFVRMRRMLADPPMLERLRTMVRTWDGLVPRSAADARAFLALTCVIAVVEELLYRGFLTWYLTPFVGTRTAFFLTPLLFAVAHLYQGWRGMANALVLGFVFSYLYAVTTSLWVPMGFHAVWNLMAAHVSRTVLDSADTTEARDALAEGRSS